MQSDMPRRLTMGWLPAPSDFRGHLRAAVETPTLGERLEKLAFLAQHRLGFLETIQLDRALGRPNQEPGAGCSMVRLAILASSTVDHVMPRMRIAILQRRVVGDLHTG